MTNATRTIPVTLSSKLQLDILFPATGVPAKTERFFNAIEPLLSCYLTSGGNKVDFDGSATAGRGPVAQALHTRAKGSLSRAWAAMCVKMKAMAAKQFASDQAGHDAALQALALEFSLFFPVPVAKAKTDTESSKQVIARLTAELSAITLERNALADKVKLLTTKPVKAVIPITITPMEQPATV